MKNKNILVVGASSGIGQALTQHLMSQGANVYTAGRQDVDEGTAHLTLDVTSEEVENHLKDFLPDALHGVVYCPGTINLKPVTRLTTEDFTNDFAVNVLGAVKVIKGCIKSLKSAKGASIVMFSTVAVGQGMPFHASVAVSKAGVEGLTRSLAAELASSKIRCNVIAPSLTDTPLAGGLLSSDDKKEAAGKRHPLGRVGTPNDIAAAAAFLLSDQSSWMTGQTIGIDGGMSVLR